MECENDENSPACLRSKQMNWVLELQKEESPNLLNELSVLKSMEAEQTRDEIKTIWDEAGKNVPVFHEAMGSKDELVSVIGAIVPTFRLWHQGDKTLLVAPSLNAKHRPCVGSEFDHQPTAATCTVFLVAPDIAVTAAHCVGEDTTRWMTDHRVVFEYSSEADTDAGFVLATDNIVTITEVEKSSNADEDWAILHLGAMRQNVTPLSIGSLSEADTLPLVALGHPLGLPLKQRSGFLKEVEGTKHFRIVMDVFHGDSGAPVLLPGTNIVIGMIVQGAPDWVPIPSEGCSFYFDCLDPGSNCKGEQVLRVDVIPFDEAPPHVSGP
ncbi:MAG: serine protease [Myxococcota bacterium]|nr:serine protease [Myxococcota bacterium]